MQTGPVKKSGSAAAGDVTSQISIAVRGNEIRLGTEVLGVDKLGDGFVVTTPTQTLASAALVIACGGPSIPKMGATGFGYKVAEQFGLDLTSIWPQGVIRWQS